MGLPIVATDNRGHRELIKNEENGYVISNDRDELKDKIIRIYENKKQFKKNEIDTYKIEKVKEKMKKIYIGEKEWVL